MPAGVEQVKAATKFPDVTSFRNEILFLNNTGVIYGYKNGDFRPNDPINRSQAVIMIMRELGLDTKNPVNPGFKDFKPGDFGYNEVAKAAELNIITGVTRDTFNPNGKLTRGQMAIILAKAYNLKGNSRYHFKDVGIKSVVYPYVSTITAHNITTGYSDGTFRPNGIMTRAQFSAFMARFLNDDFKPMIANNLGMYTIEEIAQNELSVVAIELYDENDELISQGSGFVVANQLIATNFHVISGGAKAKAVLSTGERFDLEGVVGYDDYLDVALLKPVVRTGVPPLTLASHDHVRKGEWAVAIGSPLGMQNSISEGIVSNKQVFEDEAGPVKVIQTTANITFGSSGGPLFNMNGEVIGMNSFGIEGLNFALATDYITNLLNPLKGKTFQEINTLDFASMPTIEFPDEENPEEVPNEGWQEDVIEGGLIENLPPEALPSKPEPLQGTKSYLTDLFIDVVHDPELPVLYGINENGELLSMNYITKKISRLPFSYPAESIFYANGELYVTLLKGQHSSYWWEETQEGSVAIVDPTSLKVKKMFNIAIDPYDIVADDNHFYVSSGSGQWTYLQSYNRETGAQVSSAGIRQQSQLEMHPSKTRIYAIDSDSSPRDMEVFNINNGVISVGYDSPYHGDYEMDEWMFISPDGRYIFNAAGTVFRATALKETNMQYVTDIGTPFYTIGFSEDGTEFYVTTEDQLITYSYDTFQPIATHALNGAGYFTFNHKGKLIIVGEEVPAGSKVLKTFILETE
nr:S-layer homology domain-containing protein [Fredinandcohnia sp. SECRCQ15]